MKLEIEIPNGKKAEWVDGVLTLVEDAPKDITERIKTFEDAYEWCKNNGEYDLTEQYQDAINVGLQRSRDIFAYLQLRIITCALNEGWKPTFAGYEERWSTWYNMAKYETRYGTSPKMFLFSESALLVFKSAKLAEYAATQFENIYLDFCKGKE